MDFNENEVWVLGSYIYQTDLALQVLIDDESFWIPKSVITSIFNSEYESFKVGDSIEFNVMQWFTDKEGILYE